MIGLATSSSTRAKVTASLAVGAVVAIAFLVVSRSYPLPVMIGVFPVPIAFALALGTPLALLAVRSSPSTRRPTLSMPIEDRYRILAWWVGVALTCALVAWASWRVWGVLFLLATIAATAKAVSVFSYIKQEYQFRLWLPFAAILGLVMVLVVIGGFLARPNIPPPIADALAAFRLAPGAAVSGSRAAPDLSSRGFTLDLRGDVNLGGLPTTFFSYHADDGTRIDLYASNFGFPAPPGASRMVDPAGWWAKTDGLHLRAGSAADEYLIVGAKKRVVFAVAEALSTAR